MDLAALGQWLDSILKVFSSLNDFVILLWSPYISHLSLLHSLWFLSLTQSGFLCFHTFRIDAHRHQTLTDNPLPISSPMPSVLVTLTHTHKIPQEQKLLWIHLWTSPFPAGLGNPSPCCPGLLLYRSKSYLQHSQEMRDLAAELQIQTAWIPSYQWSWLT